MPQILTARRIPATLLAIALIASVASVVTAPSRPAHAANLPRGTVTILTDSDPQPLPGASEHHKFRVSCSTVSVVADGWYAALEATGTYRGTLVFFSGGGGNFYWSAEKKGAGFLVDQLRADGFRILQVRWAKAWEDASPGESAGAGVGCRPASITEFLHDTEYDPAVPPGQAPGICGFCIAGPSGGSAQVAYALSHYELDSKLDGVFPLSGPTHAAITKGCTAERRWVQYRYDGVSTRRIDGPFGYVEASGPFARANGPCKNRIESWAPEWDAAAIDLGGGDYHHPATRVHLLIGQMDKVLRAHANDYRQALGAGGSPWVGYELVPGMGHGITEFTDGTPLAQTTKVEEFPGLWRLRNDFLLTDPAVLPACNNGFDDDGDGGIDLADTGCTAAADASELGTGVCDNGLDEDGDGRYDYSSDDFGDAGCESTADPSEQVPFGTTNLQCDDGVDNDGDGRIDFPADPGCTDPGDKFPSGNSEKQSGGGEAPIICDDGIDNDNDGFTDFLIAGGGDPDCASPEGTSETATVSISDWTDSEGGTAAFEIGMSSPAASNVTVQYSTTAGTATAPADFTAKTANVTILAGSMGPVTATVDVIEDQLDEADETFTVNLSIVSGPAGIGDGSAVGTILDDDPEPVLSVTGQSASEAASGGQIHFTVTLAPASGKTVTVSYATANGTAQAPGDYTATSGLLSFTAGQTGKTVAVPIVNDTAVEPDETFTLSLSSPNGATIGQGTATGTITNDDSTGGGGVTITITDKTVTEPDTGQTVSARFTVKLSQSSTQTVTVTFATAPGTATAGSDYKHKTGTITFSPGVTKKTVAIKVLGDVAVEPDETFFIDLSAAVNATILDPQGLGTIVNDDPTPDTGESGITISDRTVTERDDGEKGKARFTVSLASASSETITVDVATAPGTATAGAAGDYLSKSITLTFSPGQLTKQVAVTVLGDGLDEPDETFFVNLSNPVGATITDGQGLGTIVDND